MRRPRLACRSRRRPACPPAPACSSTARASTSRSARHRRWSAQLHARAVVPAHRRGVGMTTGTGGVAERDPARDQGPRPRPSGTLDMNYFLGIDGTTRRARRRLRGHGHRRQPSGVGRDAHLRATSGITPPPPTTRHDTWRLYLDGDLDRTLAVGAASRRARQPSARGDRQRAHARPASPRASSRARVDEVRIWNVRAQRERRSSSGMTQRATLGRGLLGRYGFEEGAGAAVSDSVAGAPAGTAVGGPTWATGRAASRHRHHAAGRADRPQRHGRRRLHRAQLEREHRPATSPATTSTARPRRPVPTTGTPLNGATPLAVTTYSDTTATPGTTYFYVVTAEDFANNESPAPRAPRRRPPPSRSARPLLLNGSSQYVTFGAAPALNAANFTLELWFRRTGAGVGDEHGHRRHRERDPARDQGPCRGRDAGEPQHGLLPRHRRVDRNAGRRLRGHRQRRQPPGHAARRPSRATSGITPPPSTTP